MEDNDNMIARIKEVMKYQGFRSELSFSRLLGLHQTTLNFQLAGKRKVSLDLLASILEKFPDVSAEWLMRGEGEMLKGNNAVNVANNVGVTQVGNNNNNNNSSDEIIKNLNDQIARLTETFSSEISKKNEQIDKLFDMIKS